MHRNLMTNPEWAMLSDAEKGQLVSIWIIAADKMGEVPNSPRLLKKMCMLDDEPNIERFKELGFLTGGTYADSVNVTSKCQPSDAPETETETEDNITVETKPQPQIPFSQIISFLNEKANKNYKHTTKATQNKIRARWNEGFRLSDFEVVIEKKCDEWLTDEKMVEYLRPETLFGPKFESYLQAPNKGNGKSEWT